MYLLLTFLSIVTISSNVSADNEKWKVRLRGIAIAPDDSSSETILNNTTGQGSGVDVDFSFVPELDITYMITAHWGIEAIVGIANHDVNVDGTSTGTLAAIG